MNDLIIGSGGGGGCFPAGTKVCTPTGLINIEDIQVGDTVISYSHSGIYEEDLVDAIHVHDNLEVYKYTLWGGTLSCTPNHWVLNQYNAFVPISSLTKDDCIVDVMGHLRPILSSDSIGLCTVYNLSVKKNKTFVADNVRVHNGGQGSYKPILGSGGGGGGKSGGGSSRQSVIEPDSLSSKQYARVLDLISEGEIGGLADGYKSIYFDGTPLMASDGSFNFNTSGLLLETRNGTQDQSPLSIFNTSESEISADNREVTTLSPYTITVSDPSIDRVRLNLAIPRLSNTNTTNGDVLGTTVSFKVSLKNNASAGGATFQDMVMGWTSVQVTGALAPISSTEFSPVSITGSSIVYNLTPVGGGPADTLYDTTGTEVCYYKLQYKASGSGTWIDGPSSYIAFNWFQRASYTIYNYSEYGGSDSIYTYPLEITSVYGNTAPQMWLPYYGSWDTRIVASSTPWKTAPTLVGQEWRYNYNTWTNELVNKYKPPAYFNVSSSWASVHKYSYDISGKASNPYRFSYEVDLTGKTFPVDIKVTRLTADSTNQYLQNRILVESYTKILTEKLSYPNSALVGLQLDATQFSSIPSRAYDMFLLKVKIPSGYNAYTRTYPTIWDGSFVVGWTDNPAWVFYDLLTNPRYGLGKYIAQDGIDIFQLYNIAKYCDELVPDGSGGMEPRYTCNLYLQSREEAYKVLSNLAALFSSIVYWGIGTINILSDMEEDISHVFTNANVEEGSFNYSTGSLKTTHTVALVSYIDKTNKYKPAIEYVEDTEGVKKYGIKETEVIAYGCTSRGQAHRLGRRILLTEKLENELVSFKTGINAAYCRPGNIIKIIDNTINAGNLTGGRLISSTASTINLDRDIVLKNGVTYSIMVTLSNNTVANISIVNPKGETLDIIDPGSTTSISSVTIKNSGDYFSTSNIYPITGAVWVLNSSEATTYSFWRVLSVKEAEDNIYEVNCMKYDPTKITQVESNIDLAQRKPPPGVDLEPRPIPTTIPNPDYYIGSGLPETINNVVVEESLYRLGKSDIATRINVSWQSMPDISEYRVAYRHGTSGSFGNWIKKNINVPYLEIDNAFDGDTYEIELRTANVVGRVSSPYKLTHTVIGKLAPPSNVTGFTVSRNITTAICTWDANPDVDLFGYEIRYYQGTGTPDWNTSSILVTDLSSTRYEFITSGLAVRHNFLIKAIDTTGHYSVDYAHTHFTITIPSTPTLTSSIDGEDAKLILTKGTLKSTDLPINRYDIVYGTSFASPSGDVVEGLTDVSYDKINYSSRTYWAVVYDISGNVSLSTSSTLTVQNLAAPTGLTHYYKTGVAYLSWNKQTISANNTPFKYYKLYRGVSTEYTSGTFVADVYTNSFSLPVDWEVGELEKVWVVPIDSRGESFKGDPAQFSLVPTAPSAVNVTSAVQSGTSLLVSWVTTEGSFPIRNYEVRIGGTDWASSTLIGNTSANSITIPLTSPGDLIIRIKAFDIYVSESPICVYTYSYTVPQSVTSLGYTIDGSHVKINWAPPISSTVPIDKYEILLDGISKGFTYSNSYNLLADWSGTKSIQVRAVDTSGNIGTSSSVNVLISGPTAPVVSLSFDGQDIKVSYTQPTSTLAISKYEVRKGGTAWGVGDSLVAITTETTTLDKVLSPGTSPTVYRVKATDLLGVTTGLVGESSISVNPPTITGLTTQVVDNNVLMYWTSTQGSLPIDTFEIRKGASWDSATVVGDKAGGFTTIFETTAGSYIYWVAAKDSAGNYSTPISRAATVSSPPDYIFRSKHDSIWNSFSFNGTTVTVTKNNCALDSTDNSIIAPIYTSETWNTHFSTRSWASIQDQINAGYVIYAQPSNLTSADYIEEIDYGSVIEYMKVGVSYGGTIIAGSVTITPYISYKLNIGDSWSTEVPSQELYCSNFRYVKVRLNISAANQQSLYKLTSMSIKLDAKARSDSGTIIGLESDTAGSQVTWTTGVTFTDVSSITLQPKALNILGSPTYSISGTTCTISCTSHNLVVGDKFYASFTGGTPPPAGTYTVTSKTATTIVFTVVSGSGSGTTTIRKPLYALYDFNDIPNPIGFSVYLYDSAGNRCSGTVSWTAEGY